MPSERREPPNREKSSWFGQTAAPNELIAFVFVNALDVFATYWLLAHGGYRESNPIALFFINHWGIRGMVYFKFGVVAFVCVLAHIVGMANPRLASRFLIFGTLLVAGVVVYSLVLYLRHHGGVL